ncbi:MAG TPA: hypothetical protein VGB17_11325 [Pyrinomonadaceae bacterium]|jgi:hypothetical protein
MNMYQNILLWFIAILPGSLYVLIWIAYNRILAYKRREILSIMGGGDTFGLYILAFGAPSQRQSSEKGKEAQSEDDLNETVNNLFDLYYHHRAYILPIIINTIVTTFASIITLVWANLQIAGVPDDFEARLRSLPPVVLAAFAGAYIWGLHEILRRYRTIDLSPISLHLVWWRLLIAPILGYLISLPLVDSIKVFVGFGIGAFPARTLFDLIKSQMKKHAIFGADDQRAEQPNLYMLQGFTKEMIDYLEDEGIYSAAHLAQADPIKLLLRTNLEWKVILDVIDQAILFNYIGDKLRTLGPIGIRGAIEVAVIGQALLNENSHVRRRAIALVKLIASKLGEPDRGVLNLIEMLNEDVQVTFIWALWGEASPQRYSRRREDVEESLSAGVAQPAHN